MSHPSCRLWINPEDLVQPARTLRITPEQDLREHLQTTEQVVVVPLKTIQSIKRKLQRMELQARKHRGANQSYTEGKCEGESIGLRAALRELKRVV